MPETTSSGPSSSSSCVSFGSFDEVPAVAPRASTDIKLLCSYGGKIMPRRQDGNLRYVGGHTRVLTIRRPLRFHGLYEKLRELCGWDAVSVRCQLPTEDMDALVSVTGDGDLANVLDEYDVAAKRQDKELRIRVFLHPPPGTRTAPPRALPFTRQWQLASRRRPGHLLHATRAGGQRFVPLAPGSPVRPELFCQ